MGSPNEELLDGSIDSFIYAVDHKEMKQLEQFQIRYISLYKPRTKANRRFAVCSLFLKRHYPVTSPRA